MQVRWGSRRLLPERPEVCVQEPKGYGEQSSPGSTSSVTGRVAGGRDVWGIWPRAARIDERGKALALAMTALHFLMVSYNGQPGTVQI